jgi:hypothetical protein
MKRLGRAVGVATLGVLAFGCNAETVDDSDAESLGAEQEAILGGTAVSNATVRSMGLIEVNSRCSGMLVTPDVVLTAEHCLNYGELNVAAAPRIDGGLRLREATRLIPVATRDVALLKLGGLYPPTLPGDQPGDWPQVSRTINPSSPYSLINSSVTCYGKGATEITPAHALYNFSWRKLTKTISQIQSGTNFFVVNAVNNWEILASGDSGGSCFVNDNGQPAAVVSAGVAACPDSATNPTCAGTITGFSQGWLEPLGNYKNYIDEAKNRASANFIPVRVHRDDRAVPVELRNGWKPYGTNDPGFTVINNVVYLRGALSGGFGERLFTLPAGYRPSTNVYVNTNLYGGVRGRLLIDPSGDVTVGSAGNFSDAASFTSLDGVSFALASQGSTPLTLQNQWSGSPYSTRAPAVMDDLGVVRFQGALWTSTSNTNMSPFSLPAGFRPNSEVYVPVDLCNVTKGRLIISANGAVTIQSEMAGTSAQCFTSLEGVFFPKTAGGAMTLTPSNGWSAGAYSTRGVAVRNTGGIVTLQGAITNSSGNTNTAALLLPERYRPAEWVYVPADMCGSKQGRIAISPNGWVSLDPFGPISDANCFTSLEGVQFGI